FLYLVVTYSHLILLTSYTPTATPLTYPLSLHDALPIYRAPRLPRVSTSQKEWAPSRALRRWRGGTLHPLNRHILPELTAQRPRRDRKSTRLNSSHEWISYAVFCLKKKKQDIAPECTTNA